MNITGKRLLSIILVVAFCFGLGPVLKLDLQAKADCTRIEGTYGNFEYAGLIYDNSNDNSVWISKYLDDGSAIVKVPSYIEGYPVETIGYNAFKDNKTIKKVTLPNTVKEIEGDAFRGCSNLTTIVLSNSLDHISSNAFGHCGLTSVTIPKSLCSSSWYGSGIADHAFWNCPDLKTVTFEDGSKLIPYKLFVNCESLNTVTIPNSVERICSYTFCHCPQLKQITIPKSVKILELDAFSNDTDYGDDKMDQQSLETVYGYLGTAAEEYANYHNIRFIPLDGEEPQNYNDDKYISVWSSNRSLSLFPKETMTLAFSLIEKGKESKTWEKMALSVSNPNVIEILDYEDVENGYTIGLKALSVGLTNLTITDTKTGISTTIGISVIDPSSIKMQPIKKSFGTKHINGVVFDNYWFEKNSDSYTIHLDAYNYNFFAGSIDIFDKDGSFVKSVEIERFNNPHEYYELGEKVVYLITDLSTGKLKINPFEEASYKADTVTKHTRLVFDVPEGGYFQISNNFFDSVGTLLYSTVDMAFDLIACAKEYSSLDADYRNMFLASSSTLKDRLFNKSFIKDETINTLTDLALDIFRDYYKTQNKLSINEVVALTSKIISLTNGLLSSVDLDIYKELDKAAVGTLEDIYYMTGPGVAVEATFVGVRLLDLVQGNYELNNSRDYLPYTFYTDEYRQDDNSNGVYVLQDNVRIPEVKVQAFRVFNNQMIESFSGDSFIANTELYHITLVKNDETVQPSGKVKVFIPVPTGMSSNSCTVYRQEEDYSWTPLEAHVEGKYLVFETNHFSLYAIAGKAENLSVTSLPHKLEYNLYDALSVKGLKLQYGNDTLETGYHYSPSVLTESGECEIKITFGHAETTFTVKVIKNGFVLDSDGVIRYYVNDDVDTTLNGVYQDSRSDIWYNVVKGVVTPGPTIAQNSYGWWYIDKDGKVDFTAKSIYQNKYGWWKTTNGKVTFKENGIFQNGFGWWRVKDSKVDFKAQGIYQNQYGWWKTTDGKVTFKENGVFQNEFGWWKVKDSKVDFSFTGIASNKYGSWYIKGGKVDFNKNGKVNYNNKTYTIKNGKVV